MRVKVSETDSGPWKDAALTETLKLLTAFGIRHICYCVGEVPAPVGIEARTKDELAELTKTARTVSY